MTSQLTYEIASINGLLVADDDGSSVLLANLDTVNTIYLGNENSFGVFAGSDDSVPLAPQASMVADGSVRWFAAIPAGQKAQLGKFPGGTQFDNPVGVQIALSALGLATAANQTTQNNTALATNNVLGTGIAIPIGAAKDSSVAATNTVLNSGIALPINAAKETGGNIAGVNNNTFAASNFLGGTNPGALTAVAGKSIAQDMLHANSGTTTEIAALLATGSPSGTPGGVPLVRLPGNLAQIASQALTTSGFTFYSGPVNQTSYEVGFDVSCSGTSCPVTVSVGWTPAGGGSIIITDIYTVYAGSNTGGHVIQGRGPMKAGTMSLQMFAANNTSSCTITNFVLVQSSQIYNGDLWRTGPMLAALTIPGFTVVPDLFPWMGIVGETNLQALATGANYDAVLGFYTGPVSVCGHSTSAADDAVWQLTDPLVSNGMIAEAASNAGQGFFPPAGPIGLCRNQMHIILTNNNAASKSIRATVAGLVAP